MDGSGSAGIGPSYQAVVGDSSSRSIRNRRPALRPIKSAGAAQRPPVQGVGNGVLH